MGILFILIMFAIYWMRCRRRKAIYLHELDGDKGAIRTLSRLLGRKAMDIP